MIKQYLLAYTIWIIKQYILINDRKPYVLLTEVPTVAWWRHQMETFSALLALCAGNSPVSGEFPLQRLVTRSFDVFFDLRLNKRFSKQSWGWWFEMTLCPLWRHCNGQVMFLIPTFLRVAARKYCVPGKNCVARIGPMFISESNR